MLGMNSEGLDRSCSYQVLSHQFKDRYWQKVRNIAIESGRCLARSFWEMEDKP